MCLGWAAACDCGTPWTFLLPFLNEMGVMRIFVLTTDGYVTLFFM